MIQTKNSERIYQKHGKVKIPGILGNDDDELLNLQRDKINSTKSKEI